MTEGSAEARPLFGQTKPAEAAGILSVSNSRYLSSSSLKRDVSSEASVIATERPSPREVDQGVRMFSSSKRHEWR
jgi:hypothetical protein